MNVNIKKYETLKKKNSFLDNEQSVKPINKLNNKFNRVYTNNYKYYDCHSVGQILHIKIKV